MNHSPSFITDSNLDLIVKKNLITDTFILLDIKKKDYEIYKKFCKNMSITEISNKIVVNCNRAL